MSDVRVEFNNAFWGSYMTSGAMKAKLQAAADRKAAEAEARIGPPSHRREFDNPNFTASTAVRHGKNSDYLVGLVIAANPRSIWLARHGRAFTK